MTSRAPKAAAPSADPGIRDSSAAPVSSSQSDTAKLVALEQPTETSGKHRLLACLRLRLPRLWPRSLRVRMVLVFLLLAMSLVMLFWTSAQRGFAAGWREMARPLLMDYVDHLAADIVVDGVPSIEAAGALVDRLPLTVDIRGPVVNWSSHREHSSYREQDSEHGSGESEASPAHGRSLPDWKRDFTRTTADGHVLVFGIDRQVFGRNPLRLLGGLLALLGLTALAWFFVSRSLRPLGAIEAGARRFGSGDFSTPIPGRIARQADELGTLARTMNTMGHDIQQMLDAKRALLLAISHELRSPLTRARVHAELLPDDDDEVKPQREALLRDLKEMSALVADLIESERLAGRHVVLQREPVDLHALVAEVRESLLGRYPVLARMEIESAPDLPLMSLDAARIRLLIRNLLDNAVRHGAEDQPPEVRLELAPRGPVAAAHGVWPTTNVLLSIRDFGPGVEETQLGRLAEAFYRPDAARSRRQGGVGLGLYLCRLVVEAHGGRMEFANAGPGLRVRVSLPVS